MSSRNIYDLARDPTRLFRGKKDYGISDVFRLSDTAERNLGQEFFLRLPGNVSRLNGPRCHGVDGDPKRPDLRGHAAGEGFCGGLAGTVGDLTPEVLRRIGAHIDDSPHRPLLSLWRRTSSAISNTAARVLTAKCLSTLSAEVLKIVSGGVSVSHDSAIPPPLRISPTTASPDLVCVAWYSGRPGSLARRASSGSIP